MRKIGILLIALMVISAIFLSGFNESVETEEESEIKVFEGMFSDLGGYLIVYI